MLYVNAARQVPGRGRVVLLLVVGAACQVAGILTVMIELSHSRRDATRLRQANPPGMEDESTWNQVPMLAPMLGRALRASRWRVVWVVLLVAGVGLATAGGAPSCVHLAGPARCLRRW